MLKTYLRTAFRAISKGGIISIVKIGGLAVGMTACIFIMFWVKNETDFDSYHADAENIYRITNHLEVSTGSDLTVENSPLPLGILVKNEIPGIKNVARILIDKWTKPVFKYNDRLFYENSYAYIDSGWFTMFQYDFILGNNFSFSKNPYNIIISNSKARQIFGYENPMGKILKIDTLDYVISGVIKDNPQNSSFKFDILIPIEARLANKVIAKNDNGWSNFNYITFLDVDSNQNPAKVNEKITSILRENKKGIKLHTTLVPLKSIHFETGIQNSSFNHTEKRTIYIFIVVAALIIAIACINYVNLTIATSSTYLKSVSIRKIFGAQKRQLFTLFMVESAIVSLISGLITAFLMLCLLPSFNRLTEQNFPILLFRVDVWEIIIFTLIGAALVNGIYPAIILSSFNPLDIFKGKTILRIKNTYLRKSLVIIQLSIAMIFIIGSVIIFYQLNFINKKTGNYEKAQIFEIDIPFRVMKSMDFDDRRMTEFTIMFLNNLLLKPSLKEVSFGDEPVLNVQSSGSGGFEWIGKNKDFNPSIARLGMGLNYQTMFNLSLKEGRWFIKDSKADENNFILNETAVQELNIKTPVLGNIFIAGGDTGRIIGVVKDFNYTNIHEKIGPLIIYNTSSAKSFFIKTYPGQETKALEETSDVWKKLIKDEPFKFVFLDEIFNNIYKKDTKASMLIFDFAFIAILICSSGLFTLTAYTVNQRAKEIGIRKVMGASHFSVFLMLSEEFIHLYFISLCIAVPVSVWLMHKWLRDFAYQTPLGVEVFVFSAALAFITGFLTVSIQILRISSANPVKSLRSE